MSIAGSVGLVLVGEKRVGSSAEFIHLLLLEGLYLDVALVRGGRVGVVMTGAALVSSIY